jgi:hypothetical protein
MKLSSMVRSTVPETSGNWSDGTPAPGAAENAAHSEDAGTVTVTRVRVTFPVVRAKARRPGPPPVFGNRRFGTQRGEGYEYHLLVLAMTTFLVIRGAGAFSVDRALSVAAPSGTVQRRLARS